MNKLLPGIVIGLSLLALGAQAQVFRPGQLVLATGDTLRGEIEDNSWNEAPTEVRFRPAAGTAIISYAPAAVRAFQLQSGQYFRYETLPLDRAAHVATNQLLATITYDQHPESFLAEVLVDGPASLLRTMVEDVPHYFVRRDAQPYLELSARRYLREQGGHQFIADANNYRAELLRYLGDCPAATALVGVAAFTPAGLTAVVQAYNRQCTAAAKPGAEYKSLAANRQLGYSIGVVGGARYGSCQLRVQPPAGPTVLDDANLDGVVHPLAGLYADILTPGRRFALHLTGLLLQIGRDANLPAQEGAPTIHINNRLTIAEFRLGMRFFSATTQRGQRYFVGTGITVPYGVSSNYSPTLLYYDANQHTLASSSAPDAYPSSVLLPYLEAGVRHNRLTLTLDGRVQRTNTYYITSYTPSALPGAYFFYERPYSYHNWYVSATLGWALLHSH